MARPLALFAVAALAVGCPFAMADDYYATNGTTATPPSTTEPEPPPMDADAGVVVPDAAPPPAEPDGAVGPDPCRMKMCRDAGCKGKDCPHE